MPEPTRLRRICVYCGSRHGERASYATAAKKLGETLVRRGLGLVYGGGSVGLMGVLADAVLANNGEVHGVIPEQLAKKEIMHHGLTELHVVRSMHERKALMAKLSDGFIALPGGYGTLEETLEIITWAQLGIHRKPIGLLNLEGYYDGLLKQIEDAFAAGFIRPEFRRLFICDSRGSTLLEAMDRYEAPEPILKVMGLEET